MRTAVRWVLNVSGSTAVLAELERSNLLVVPLDRRGDWYRYHHLFHDMLLAELHRQEPGLMLTLHRRAAQWYERNGEPEEALEYWMKAGEVDSAARLFGALAFVTYQRGRIATVERWLGWLEDHAAMERYPAVAVLGALFYALTGKPAYAERWADVAERAAGRHEPAGREPVRRAVAGAAPGAAVPRRGGADAGRRGARGYGHGPGQLLADHRHDVPGGRGPDGRRSDRADVLFADVIAEGQAGGIAFGPCIALAERSLLAVASGDWDLGKRYLSEARSLAREGKLEDYPPVTILYTVAARVALHEADRPRAEAELTRAQRLRPGLTHAVPHLAVQARIELARCYLALSDFGAARTLLREADEILVRRPRLGVFVRQAADLRAELSRARGSSALGASALTTAELRLLPMLSTHLSFPEIAEEMFLSRHTVKAEAMSIYRKLGVSSRNQAVGRSRELALLDK